MDCIRSTNTVLTLDLMNIHDALECHNSNHALANILEFRVGAVYISNLQTGRL